MILRTYLFRKVTIIGVGLMGGSLALALKKHKVAKEITGFSNRKTALDEARKKKVIDLVETDLERAVKNADLIVLATPVDTIAKLLTQIHPFLKRNTVVTDLGSAKAAIIETAEKHMDNANRFIGSHPLIGSEKTGVANAADDLFQGTTCILTPTKDTSKSVRDKVKQMWNKLGANVVSLEANEHDEALAYVSHVPHLLSFALMTSTPERLYPYASRGFKDMTRISGSSPLMWSDICIANSKNIANSLDQCIERLAHLRKAIVLRDRKALPHLLAAAQKARESFLSKNPEQPDAPSEKPSSRGK